MRKLLVTSAVFGALLISSSASATGLSTARFGGELGHPTATNPTSIYYNPAGVVGEDGIQFFVDGNIALRQASYERVAPTPAPADADANYGTGRLFNVVAAPMLGATGRFAISDDIKLGVGVGLFVPFGGSAKWSKNDNYANGSQFAGPSDGAQRWYSIDGGIRSMYLSGAVGVSLFDDLISIGVSGGVAFNSIDSLRARNALGSSDDISSEGRVWLNAASLDPQLGGGVIVQPIKDKLWIGASYQAPPGFGKIKMKGLLNRYFSGIPSGQTSPDDDVEIHQHLPDIISLGARFRPTEDVELRLFGNYTRWSLFKDQCIAKAGDPCEVNEDGSDAPGTTTVANLPRRWNDGFTIRMGASHWFTPDIQGMIGLGYDSNVIPDENLDPAITDFDDVSIAFGGRFQFIKELAGAITYTQFIYIDRDTTGKSANPTFQGTSAAPDAGGIYRQTIGVININIHGQFDPFTPSAPDAPATTASAK